MSKKILFLGNPDACKALLRALTKIESLRREVAQFVNSLSIEDYLEIGNYEDIEKSLNDENTDVKLIIIVFDYENDLLNLIKGASSRVPIILISPQDFRFTELTDSVISCLKSCGTYLPIPFSLVESYYEPSLESCLIAARSIEPQKVSCESQWILSSLYNIAHHFNKKDINSLRSIISELLKQKELSRKAKDLCQEILKMVSSNNFEVNIVTNKINALAEEVKSAKQKQSYSVNSR